MGREKQGSAELPGPPEDAVRIEQLLREVARLKVQVAARNQFLDIAADELRNPMHTMAMHIDAAHMLATARGDRAIADRLQLAQTTLRWFLMRSTLLLDMPRMATGLLHLELGSVDLREVIRNVENLYAPQTGLTETSLQVKCEGPLIGRWDGPVLEQALGNLVSNAIKFGAGSPIMLTAYDPENGVIKVQVADHGIGMSNADQERMLEDFDDIILTTDHRKGGFGVGLWLARNLVEAHGGYLEIFSESGAGTTITMYLPKTPPAMTTSG